MIVSIDGSFMLHRARFVAGKNGTPTRDHTLVIFMNIFLRTLQQFTPSKVYVYFDRARSYHRLKLYPEYKGHRKESDDDPTLLAYKLSRDFLVDGLPRLGFITILCDGIEADDFGYLTAYNYGPGVHVTDDKDWYYNLFSGWSLFRPKANEMISYEQFCTMVSHQENPRMIYLIARAITGDKSDNIPGVRGVPWVQALPLALRIFQRQDLGDSRYAKKALDFMDQIKYNIKIMTPIWILQSEEARSCFDDAEANVSKEFSQALHQWKYFSDQLVPDARREMLRLGFDYNVLVQKLSYV